MNSMGSVQPRHHSHDARPSNDLSRRFENSGIFFCFLYKHVVGTHKMCLSEVFLQTHKNAFLRGSKKTDPRNITNSPDDSQILFSLVNYPLEKKKAKALIIY